MSTRKAVARVRHAYHVDKLLRPFQIFAANKLAGAILLMGATAVAMLWANSRYGELYEQILQTQISVGPKFLHLTKPLLLWINDGLMSFFFFTVGLEIKREVIGGELSSMRRASLPLFAAASGMLVPAAIYLGFNYGTAGQHGWGVPMATDIAFALGVLALLGDRIPIGLKVFLTALAIVDDIGAILVIAVFYTDSVSMGLLTAGGVAVLLSLLANLLGVRNSVFYFVLGTITWLAFLKSGIHATLAAVLMAFTIPARSRLEGAPFVGKMKCLLDELENAGLPVHDKPLQPGQQHLLEEMANTVGDANAPLQRLEHALNPLVAFGVLPLFALANAGVVIRGNLSEALTDSVTMGVIAGLFFGKQIGIVLFSWLGVKLQLADLPRSVRWRELYGVAILGGIGFTMSIFVASLAFPNEAMLQMSKIGILFASSLSGVVGWGLLRLFLGKGPEVER